MARAQTRLYPVWVKPGSYSQLLEDFFLHDKLSANKASLLLNNSSSCFAN